MKTTERVLVALVIVVAMGSAAVAGAEESGPAPAGESAPAPVPAESAPATPAKKAPPASSVYFTGGGGAIIEEARAAFTGTATILRPIGGFFALEIALGAGWSPSGPAKEDLFWGRINLGARFEATRAAVRPFASLRLTHVHMATLMTWHDHPLASAAGSSEHGLGHRSGIAIAGGISAAVPGTKGHLRLVVDAEMLWIAIGHGPRWLPALQTGLGWSF